MSKNITPRWQNPNKPIPPKDVDPAATPVKPKPAKRSYISDAVAALDLTPSPAKNGEALRLYGGAVAAIIIAQAIDRFGEKLIQAAAVSQYKRTP